MSIRVLMILPTHERGGAARQVSLLASHLPANRFDVHVCVLGSACLSGDARWPPAIAVDPRHPQQFTSGGSLRSTAGTLSKSLSGGLNSFHEVGWRWTIDPAAYWRLRQYIRRLAPDIVHTWKRAANLYGRHAALGAAVPCVVASRRCIDHRQAWSERFVDRYLDQRTRRIVANSPAVRDHQVARGIAAERISIIADGVPAIEPPSRCDHSALLQALRLPDNARLIGAIGRLSRRKRLKDLIWAAELLKVARPDTHLLIIGDGPQRQRLEGYCQRLAIWDRVHFLGHRDDVDCWIAQLDCLWLAGGGLEGPSAVLMEAMAAGIPVIATDNRCNRELIQSGEDGFLIPLGDRAALARKTHLILQDDTLARRLGAAARQQILDVYRVERMVQGYGDLYEQLSVPK